MSGILTYALHYEGAFNKNSLGAVSEGAKLAKEIGGEAAVVVVGGEDLTDDLCASLGGYGATKVYRASAPEGLAQPVVDAMAKVIRDDGYSYALFGGGLLAPLDHDGPLGVLLELDVDVEDLGLLIARGHCVEGVQAADDDARVSDVLHVDDRRVLEDRALGHELSVLGPHRRDLHGHARVEARR